MSRPRHVLVAPDKFKATLSAVDAARVIAGAVRRHLPHATVVTAPVADGGEGTVDAVVAGGGHEHRTTVSGPLGTPTSARWATIDDRAVVEMAAASGLQLLEPDQASAMAAHSIGTGELIRTALDHGYRRIAIGLGGSASSDGGLGALQALGARALDTDGAAVAPGGGSLERITRLDLAGLDPRLAATEVVVCCDVAVPLSGPNGAAAVFAPQKGADPDTVALLDSGLVHLARLFAEASGRDPSAIPWGGAAGGTAGGFYAALNATFSSGFDEVAHLLDIDGKLDHTELVIVGEGKLDSQSLTGKAPVALAERARDRTVPAVAVAGILDIAPAELAPRGIHAARSAVEAAGVLTEALRRPEAHLHTATLTVLADHDHHLRRH